MLKAILIIAGDMWYCNWQPSRLVFFENTKPRLWQHRHLKPFYLKLKPFDLKLWISIDYVSQFICKQIQTKLLYDCTVDRNNDEDCCANENDNGSDDMNPFIYNNSYETKQGEAKQAKQGMTRICFMDSFHRPCAWQLAKYFPWRYTFRAWQQKDICFLYSCMTSLL